MSNPWVISRMCFSSSTGCTFMEVLARACCLVPIFLITAELSFCLFLYEGHPRGSFGLLLRVGGGSSRRCEWHVWKYNNPSIPGCSSSQCFQQASGLAAFALRGFYLTVLGVETQALMKIKWNELSLCSSSGGITSSGCRFIQPGQ